jgi:hypothetical protein
MDRADRDMIKTNIRARGITKDLMNVPPGIIRFGRVLYRGDTSIILVVTLRVYKLFSTIIELSYNSFRAITDGSEFKEDHTKG